jgi:chemotaxis protein CheX
MRNLSKEQLAAPVVRGVKEVILELTGLELKEHTEHPADSSIVGKELTVLVGIVGALEGQISYSISKDFACRFASTLLGDEITTYGEMSESAICELGNMVTGRATVLLQEDGFICDLCPPSIVMAQNVKISSNNIETHIVHMSGEWGIMEVHIALTPSPGKQRAKKEEHQAPTVTGIITADILLSDMRVLFEKGEYNKAIEAARIIAELNFACSTKLSELCRNEGIRLYKNRNIQNALQVLEIASEFDAFSFETCIHLGHCYSAQENWPLALHNYRTAAGIETGNSDCFFHVGYCLYNMGSYEKALRALNVAVNMGHKKANELVETITKEI